MFGALGGSTDGVENKAASSGMDPALIQGVIAMLSGGGGAGGAAGAEGGSGFNLGSLIQGKKLIRLCLIRKLSGPSHYQTRGPFIGPSS